MIVAGLILTASLGWLLLPRRLDASPVEGLALGFALLAFGISAEIFVMGVAGFLPPAWLALTPCLEGDERAARAESALASGSTGRWLGGGRRADRLGPL